jgi:hypothetical protein
LSGSQTYRWCSSRVAFPSHTCSTAQNTEHRAQNRTQNRAQNTAQNRTHRTQHRTQHKEYSRNKTQVFEYRKELADDKTYMYISMYRKNEYIYIKLTTLLQSVQERAEAGA